MPVSVRRINFHGGQVDEGLLFIGNDLGVNSSPRLSNVVPFRGAISRRSGTTRISKVEGGYANVGSESSNTYFVDSGYVYEESLQIWYYDFINSNTYNLGASADYARAQVVRTRDYIIYFSKTNLDYIELNGGINREWDVLEGVQTQVETYPPYRKIVYNAGRDFNIETMVELRVVNTEVTYIDSNEAQLYFKMDVLKGIFESKRFGSFLKTTITTEDSVSANFFKKTLKEQLFFRVLVIEDVEDDTMESITCEIISADRMKITKESLDAKLVGITEIRTFVSPDVMAIAGGRYIAVTGNTLCVSEVGNPLNYRESLDKEGNVYPPKVHITAFSDVFSGVDAGRVNNIISLDSNVYLIYDDSFRVLYSSDGSLNPLTISTLTASIKGKFVGSVNSLLVLSSYIGELAICQWNVRQRSFDIAPMLNTAQGGIFNVGIKKAIQISDGLSLMVLLNDGRCVIVNNVGNNGFAIYPLRFGDAVYDIASYKNSIYLYVRRSDDVYLESWDPGGNVEWDVGSEDILAEVDFFTWESRNLSLPPSITPYIKVLGDVDGVVLETEQSANKTPVSTNKGTIGIRGETDTGIPPKYTLSWTRKDATIKGIYISFKYNQSR